MVGVSDINCKIGYEDNVMISEFSELGNKLFKERLNKP
jgi:hypothetical protein